MNEDSIQKKILIVEDEPVLMEPLEEKLSRKNYAILKATNGKEALDMALAHHPDLILLDIVMPVMDGISVLKALRKDEWGKEVKTIILTNLTEGRMLKEGEEQHVLDYLVKADWTLDDLVKKVETILQ
jgi:DNA-binding response OmpR family regulator